MKCCNPFEKKQMECKIRGITLTLQLFLQKFKNILLCSRMKFWKILIQYIIIFNNYKISITIVHTQDVEQMMWKDYFLQF